MEGPFLIKPYIVERIQKTDYFSVPWIRPIEMMKSLNFRI